MTENKNLDELFLYALTENYKDSSNEVLTKITDKMIDVYYEFGLEDKIDHILKEAKKGGF